MHESASLALSNAAITHFMNPAVGGERGHLMMRSNFGTTSPYNTNLGFFDTKLVHVGLSYTDRSFWFAFQVQEMGFEYVPNSVNDFGPDRYSEYKLHLGYQLTRTLSVGAGAKFNPWSIIRPPDDRGIDVVPSQRNQHWGFDAGVYYTDSFGLRNSNIHLRPELGLSLNHIGNDDEFLIPSKIYLSQAGQLRWSGGLSVSGGPTWGEREIVTGGFYGGLTKYFSRFDASDEGRGSGFSSIFTNWGAFDYPRGDRSTISALEQIAFGAGARITFLETLSVNFGRLSGADRWVHARSSWGLDLDISYFTLSVTQIRYTGESMFEMGSNLLFGELRINFPVSAIQ